MNWNLKRCACLLLAYRDCTAPDVLAPHSDDIAAPLRRIEQQRKRQARSRADGVPLLVLGDLRFGPGMHAVRFQSRQFYALCRIVGAETFANRKL